MAREDRERSMLTTPISCLRVVAFAEGCSYLLLLRVAMPLKYFAGLPLAVKIVGSLHGALFFLFCATLLQALVVARWSDATRGRRVRLVSGALLHFRHRRAPEE